MKVGLHAVARLEYRDAVAWYAARDVAVALRFVDAIDVAIHRIAEFPMIGPPHPRLPAVRQVRLSRFPFILPYRLGTSSILVLAVAHTGRRQEYWSRRGGPR